MAKLEERANIFGGLNIEELFLLDVKMFVYNNWFWHIIRNPNTGFHAKFMALEGIICDEMHIRTIQRLERMVGYNFMQVALEESAKTDKKFYDSIKNRQ